MKVTFDFIGWVSQAFFFFQSRVITLYPHSGIHQSNIQAHPLGNRELYDDFNCCFFLWKCVAVCFAFLITLLQKSAALLY